VVWLAYQIELVSLLKRLCRMFGLVALDSDGLDLWDLSGLTSSVYFD